MADSAIFASPPLSIGNAHILNGAFTLTYVVPLYLTKYTMPAYSSKEPTWRWRDDPKVIRARMASVTLSTLAICAYVYLLFTSNELVCSVRNIRLDLFRRRTDENANFRTSEYRPQAPHGIGLIPDWDLFGIPVSCGLALSHQLCFSALYTPNILRRSFLLWSTGVTGSTLRTRSSTGGGVGTSSWCVSPSFPPYFGLKEMQGPISEELVWRSCILCVYRLAGASRNLLIFFTPLSFGAGKPPD